MSNAVVKKTTILTTILEFLNLQEKDQGQIVDLSEKSTPELVAELGSQMLAAENSATMAMALAGRKRTRLAELLQQQDALRAKAEQLECGGQGGLAKAALTQALALNSEIAQLAADMQSMDLQAQREIVSFRTMEKTAERLESEIERANQVDHFNQIRQRFSSATSQLQRTVVQELQQRVEGIYLTDAQLNARNLLQAERTQAELVNMQIEQVLTASAIDAEYAALQTKVKAAGELPSGETTALQALPSPADSARKLLEAPMFGGLVKVS